MLEVEFVFRMPKRMYKQKKGGDEDFEVLYVGFVRTCYKTRIIEKMPWLVHDYREHLAKKISRRIFGPSVKPFAVVALGGDGKLMAKERGVESKTTWNDAFPYIDEDLKKQTMQDLIVEYNWDQQ